MKKLIFVLVVVMLALNASAVNYFANGGFEDPVLADGTSTTVAPTSWDWIEHNSTHLNPSDPPTPPDPNAYEGDNMIMTQGSLRAVGQNVAIPGGLQAGTVYTFTIQVNGFGGFNIDFTNWEIEQDFFPDTGGEWIPYSMVLDTAVETSLIGQTQLDFELVHLPAQYGGSDTEPLYFDAVFLGTEDEFDPNAPRATDPQPADDSSTARICDLLQWRGQASGVGYGLPIEHQVYFGTNETTVTDGTVPDGYGTPDTDPTYVSYDPGTLLHGTEYFWRIDEKYDLPDDGEYTRKGRVWRFETASYADGYLYYERADMNNDCYIDLNDFAEWALKWLTCDDPGDPACSP